MLRYVLIVLSFFAISSANAQSADDPAFLKKLIDVVQQQRDRALNSSAITEAKVNFMAEEISNLNAKIKELEAKEVSNKPKE
jgi:TolA-binding protein